MKITPLEIRKKTFEKSFRGYEKEEVDGFLQSLATEWERLIDEHKQVQEKLGVAEEEVKKLREVESSLYKTLKTAEDTGANLVEQSKKEAEITLKESQVQSEAVLNEANNTARGLIEEAETKASEIVEEAKLELRSLEDHLKAMLRARDEYIEELKHLGQGLMARADKEESKELAINSFVKRLKEIETKHEPGKTKKSDPQKEKKKSEEPKREESISEDLPKEEVKEVQKEGEKANGDGGSFFDQIDD